jgi:hypothetical protein
MVNWGQLRPTALSGRGSGPGGFHGCCLTPLVPWTYLVRSSAYPAQHDNDPGLESIAHIDIVRVQFLCAIWIGSQVINGATAIIMIDTVAETFHSHVALCISIVHASQVLASAIRDVQKPHRRNAAAAGGGA